MDKRNNWFKRDSGFKNYQIIIFGMIMMFITFILALFIFQFGENQLMGNYDLYQCIYNNADDNGFNQNPIMIDKIQDECICFRNYNYENLLEANCSNYNAQFDEEAYFKGLMRGCDIGCIDYDLRQHNISWNTSEEVYSVLNSTKYRKCSAFCVENYRR